MAHKEVSEKKSLRYRTVKTHHKKHSKRLQKHFDPREILSYKHNNGQHVSLEKKKIYISV